MFKFITNSFVVGHFTLLAIWQFISKNFNLGHSPGKIMCLTAFTWSFNSCWKARDNLLTGIKSNILKQNTAKNYNSTKIACFFSFCCISKMILMLVIDFCLGLSYGQKSYGMCRIPNLFKIPFFLMENIFFQTHW